MTVFLRIEHLVVDDDGSRPASRTIAPALEAALARLVAGGRGLPDTGFAVPRVRVRLAGDSGPLATRIAGALAASMEPRRCTG